jgi:transmembrane sensor
MSAGSRRADETVPDPAAVAWAAAQWMVRISDDDPAVRAAALAGFAAWKREHPSHARVAARMNGLIGQLEQVREQAAGDTRPARAALAAAHPVRRRRAGQTAASLAVACALALPAYLALRAYPPSYLLADMRTGSGEWMERTLPDGSRLALSSDSAVDLRFGHDRRVLSLVRGELMVDVAPDAARPFIVATPQADIRALGTRLAVSRRDGATVLDMLESQVSVQAAQRPADAAVVVDAGERVRITAQGIGPKQAIDARSATQAWRHRQLVAGDRPLVDVLDELARHRHGWLGYDRNALAGLRVTAVLPLDDTDRALQLLLQTFPPLRIRRATSYLVWVDAPIAAPASP